MAPDSIITAASESASGWTIDTLKVHYDALLAADERFHIERDRRYEANRSADAKALTIKETADLAALSLARERQSYEADRADKLRDQSMSERGAYVTRDDLAQLARELNSGFESFKASVQPLFAFMSSQKGVTQGTQLTTAKMLGLIAAAGTIAGVTFALVNLVAK